MNRTTVSLSLLRPSFLPPRRTAELRTSRAAWLSPVWSSIGMTSAAQSGISSPGRPLSRKRLARSRPSPRRPHLPPCGAIPDRDELNGQQSPDSRDDEALCRDCRALAQPAAERNQTAPCEEQQPQQAERDRRSDLPVARAIDCAGHGARQRGGSDPDAVAPPAIDGSGPATGAQLLYEWPVGAASGSAARRATASATGEGW